MAHRLNSVMLSCVKSTRFYSLAYKAVEGVWEARFLQNFMVYRFHQFTIMTLGDCIIVSPF